MNWIEVETTTAWLLAMLGAACGVALIATGMMEDLFEIVRNWWAPPRPGSRHALGNRRPGVRNRSGRE